MAWFIAWSVAIYLVFVTWGPLVDRPRFGHPQIERFGAFLLAGAAFAAAYPRRPATVAIAAILGAVLLEVGQSFLPYRHAHLVDCSAKVAGGLCGVVLLETAKRLLAKRRAQSAGPSSS
jgi:hypothetical protein